MEKRNKIIIITLLSIIFLFVFLRKGFENKVDPLWIKTKDFINTDTPLLNEKRNELQKIYDSIHPNAKENVISLIDKPFLPIMSWVKFNNVLNRVLSEKKVVIIGASGTGKSTIIDRIAIIITGKKSNITKITCVEGLERDYNNEWIGHYNKNGFEPGKLLNLFEKCKKNYKQNYVLIIDDFDKVYRSTFFGASLWNELENSSYKNEIRGYKEIEIPDNLYIISTGHPATLDKIPFTSEDYRRLTNGTPYILEPNLTELKEYFLINNRIVNTDLQKKTLLNQLYYFSKINSLIEEKIGQSAIIGQWSGIQKLLKKPDFNSLENFIIAYTAKFELLGKLTKKDFDNIHYSIENNGKVRGTSDVISFFKKMIDLGLLSELSVAILFAFFSFISFRRTRFVRKRNIDNMLDDIEFIEKKYLNNVIHYNNAYGNLLSIKEDIQEMSKKGKLDFSQANYLIHQLNESLKTIDFVNELGKNNDELSNFMKIIIADDDITKEEYNEHIFFLLKNQHRIESKTYHTVKQQLIKLYHKSKIKHGRV